MSHSDPFYSTDAPKFSVLYEGNYCFITMISFVFIKYVNLYTLRQYEIRPEDSLHMIPYETEDFMNTIRRMQLRNDTGHLTVLIRAQQN